MLHGFSESLYVMCDNTFSYTTGTNAICSLMTVAVCLLVLVLMGSVCGLLFIRTTVTRGDRSDWSRACEEAFRRVILRCNFSAPRTLRGRVMSRKKPRLDLDVQEPDLGMMAREKGLVTLVI